jgi:hypothetical protein
MKRLAARMRTLEEAKMENWTPATVTNCTSPGGTRRNGPTEEAYWHTRFIDDELVTVKSLKPKGRSTAWRRKDWVGYIHSRSHLFSDRASLQELMNKHGS